MAFFVITHYSHGQQCQVVINTPSAPCQGKVTAISSSATQCPVTVGTVFTVTGTVTPAGSSVTLVPMSGVTLLSAQTVTASGNTASWTVRIDRVSYPQTPNAYVAPANCMGNGGTIIFGNTP